MPVDGSISLVLGHLCKPVCKDYLVPSIPAALESEAEEQSEPDKARQKPLSRSAGSSCAHSWGGNASTCHPPTQDLCPFLFEQCHQKLQALSRVLKSFLSTADE